MRAHLNLPLPTFPHFRARKSEFLVIFLALLEHDVSLTDTGFTVTPAKGEAVKSALSIIKTLPIKYDVKTFEGGIQSFTVRTQSLVHLKSNSLYWIISVVQQQS